MKKSCLLVGFFGILFGAMAVAQKRTVPQSTDSLVQFLTTSPKDTLYLQALADYAWKKVDASEYKAGDSLAKVLLTLTQQLKNKKGEFDSYDLRGRSAYVQGKYNEALDFYKKTLQLTKSSSLGFASQQRALTNVGMILHLMGNNEEGLKYVLESIKIFERERLPKLSGSSPYDIAAAIYHLQGKNEVALKYFQQSLEIKTKEKNYRGLAVTNNRIGSLLAEQKEYQRALSYLQKADIYAQQANYEAIMVDIAINLSLVYRALNKPKEDLAALKKGEESAKKLHLRHHLGAIYGNLGQYYQSQKQYQKAETYLKDALSIFKEIGSLEYQGYIYQALREMFVEKGDYKQAYENQQVAQKLSDSLFSQQQKARMDELSMKFETERKEQQIKLLQKESELKSQQNRLWLIGGGLALLLALVSIVFVINRAKYRRLQESLQLRNKIAADLHDEIGSTLSSISLMSGLTQKQLATNQPQKAEQMVRKISADARQMLESMDDIVWTINPSNDSMQHLFVRLREYAKPLAESKEIALDFVTDAQVEALSLPLQVRQNVYLIVKEALNNAFKYAQASKISVEFSGQGDEWNVSVIDNGVGFEVAAVNTRNGLKNMKKRVEEIGGTLVMESVLQKGSEVRLNFKN